MQAVSAADKLFGIFLKWFGVFYMTPKPYLRYLLTFQRIMSRHLRNSGWLRPLVLVTTACVLAVGAAETNQTVRVRAAGFVLGKEISASDATNHFQFALENSGAIPFVQSAVKQSADVAKLGPDPKLPYFTVRFALPIPPENATNNAGELAGLGSQVFTHNHSPGFEILPNGDALAIFFSTPPGKAEADVSTSFIQARLRYGAEDWDLPELFFKTENFNDQSGCSGTMAEKSVSSAAGGKFPTRFHFVRPLQLTTARRGLFPFRSSTRWPRLTKRNPSRADFGPAIPFTSRWMAAAHTVFFGAAKTTAFTGVTWAVAPAADIR